MTMPKGPACWLPHAIVASLQEIRVKGSTLLGVLTGVREVCGERAEGMIAGLKGELGETVRTRSLVALGWYPIAWHRELLAMVVANGGQVELREVIRTSTRHSMSSIHRLIVKVFSPDTLLRQSSRLFSSFFEAELLTHVQGPRQVRVEWKECHGFDRNVWQAQVITVDELVAMTGSKVKSRTVTAGGTDGDSSMSLDLHWLA
jgi:hypothetical protein